MARNPTWYSIRNRLEAGSVKSYNELERFLTVIVSSYGCLDLWYQNIRSDSNEIVVRIQYMQKDPTYTAVLLNRTLNSWERSGERPEFWLQVKGTTAEIRATFIGLLPRLSRLQEEKCHGEWNFGSTQPFDGQGSIITRVGDQTILTGRFGDISANNNGTPIDWDSITWSFDGCDVEATLPETDDVCLAFPPGSIPQCEPDVTLGTCIIGGCGAYWDGVYPTVRENCVATPEDPIAIFIPEYDHSQQPQSFFESTANLYGYCTPETGTCVTGTCDNWTIGTNTQATCEGLGGVWYGDNVVPQNPLGLNAAAGCGRGCCVLGNGCDFEVHQNVTSLQCDGLLATSTYSHKTFTDGQDVDYCNPLAIATARGCQSNPPQKITVAVEWKFTSGYPHSPAYLNEGWECPSCPQPGWYSVPFWYFADTECSCPTYGDPYWGGSVGPCGSDLIPAITPGAAYTVPAFQNHSTTAENTAFINPTCAEGGQWNCEVAGRQPCDDSPETIPLSWFDVFGNCNSNGISYNQKYDTSGYNFGGAVANGTITVQVEYGLVSGDSSSARYEPLMGGVHKVPVIQYTPHFFNMKKREKCEGMLSASQQTTVSSWCNGAQHCWGGVLNDPPPPNGQGCNSYCWESWCYTYDANRNQGLQCRQYIPTLAAVTVPDLAPQAESAGELYRVWDDSIGDFTYTFTASTNKVGGVYRQFLEGGPGIPGAGSPNVFSNGKDGKVKCPQDTWTVEETRSDIEVGKVQVTPPTKTETNTVATSGDNLTAVQNIWDGNGFHKGYLRYPISAHQVTTTITETS